MVFPWHLLGLLGFVGASAWFLIWLVRGKRRA
jgi:hypothetical protein